MAHPLAQRRRTWPAVGLGLLLSGLAVSSWAADAPAPDAAVPPPAAEAPPTPSAAPTPPPAPPAAPPAPPAANAASGSTPYGYPPAHFDALWQKRQAAMAQGDYPASMAVLHQLVDAKNRSGWPDMPVLGEALALESRQVGATGDWKRALELASDAFDLAPHRQSTQRALAAARWGTGDVMGSFATLATGMGLVLAEPPLLVARLGSIGLLALFAALGACVALAMAGLYRHYLAIMHHLTRHVLPAGATPLQAAGVVAAFLFLPALLCLGAVWSCLLWLAVLGPFFEKRERWGAMMAVVLVALVAGLLPWVMEPLAYAGSRQELVYQAVRDVNADVTSLGQPAGRPQEAYALGLRARWSGDGRRAVLFLDKAAQQGMNNPELFVSLGNARLLLGDPLAAVQSYQQALNVDPQNLLALFNLSQVYLNLADPKAAEVRKRADDINVRAVAKLAAYTQVTGLLAVEPDVPRVLLASTADADPEHARAIEQLWRFFGGPTPRWLVFPAALAVLAWLVLQATGERDKRFAHACNRCGEPACTRCHANLPDAALCADCHHAFERNGPQQLRIRKEIDSHRFHARVLSTQRVFNVVLAGGGQLLRGEAIRGLVLMMLFLTTALGLLTGFELLPEWVPSYGTSAGVFRVGGGVLFAALYVLAVLDGQRDRA